jgi:UDP-N-acetylmuramoyl-L-alanyl-D-glutamate--2,6-diaminopimelate ligase
MEVSSHAVELHRISGIHYQVAVFTGLSQDHLDFHLTMENYFAAKARLFTPEFAEAGVVCVDDEWGRRLAGSASIPLTTYAVSTEADWTAKSIQRNQDGTVDFVAVNNGHELPIRLSMPGDFNIANALAALASIQTAGFNLETAATALESIAVPGRVERIESGQPFVVLVDYAHTPDAVERALKVAHTCTNQDVISVLGCGGDRDRTKRPQMGKAAAEQSYLIVTDDNPRSEVPATIRAEVLAGVPQSARAIEIADRKAAIRHALEMAKPGDCVIILGKGHERGQEISGIVQPFDDREIAREILREIYG